MKAAIYSAFFVVLIALAGCGGGGGGGGGGSRGYTGSESPATVTDANVEDVVTTAREGTKAAIDSTAADSLTPRTASANVTDTVASISKRLAGIGSNATRSVAPRFTDTIAGTCASNPGSATLSTPDSSTEYQGSATITYRHLCLQNEAPDGGDLTVNGVVTMQWSETRISINYNNVTVSYGGQTQTLNMAMTCVGTNWESCTYTSDFTGSDGRTYRIEDFDVYGDDVYGYTVYATVYHPDHGYVEISGNNITLCDNGNIETGQIFVSDSAGPALQLNFNGDCETVTVTRDSLSETFPQ